MRGTERVSKVFIDSRYCLSDGSIEIPGGGLLLDPTDRCWLAEFSAVSSWDTVDATNSVLYVQEPSNVLRAIALSQGPHDLDSLAADMEARLNGPGRTVAGLYSVSRAAPSGGGGGSIYKAFLITNNSAFALPRDPVIRHLWQINKRTPTNSTNTLFSFPTGDYGNTDQMSGFVDLRRAHSIFIHAPGFGAANTIGVTGMRNILAKVPVDVGYGQAIHWTMSGSDHDSVEVGMHSLTILTMQLRDVAGNILDLKGSHWSATLVFGK
jgi:hypothetical protein